MSVSIQKVYFYREHFFFGVLYNHNLYIFMCFDLNICQEWTKYEATHQSLLASAPPVHLLEGFVVLNL